MWWYNTVIGLGTALVTTLGEVIGGGGLGEALGVEFRVALGNILRRNPCRHPSGTTWGNTWVKPDRKQ